MALTPVPFQEKEGPLIREKNINELRVFRREFMGTLVAGAVGLYGSTILGGVARASTGEKVDIGVCKSVKILCVTETSWFDNARILEDIKNAGGPGANQYQVPWNKKNSGGYSALIQVEALDGTTRRFLLDVGWNQSWMDYSFQREGIDDMLRKGELEFVYISHEHMDHFWGLPVITKYRPDTPVYISDQYHPEGKAFIAASGHKGPVRELPSGKVHVLFPGCGSVIFNIPILLRVQGSRSCFLT